jgi:signal transduction histidine kinase
MRWKIYAYFIITELFNNIIKHSGAKKTQIRLKEKYNKLIIVLQDDGIGFNSKKTSELEGFGLNRIKARIKKFKGSFEIISELNEGTTVKIKIPIPH